MARNARAFTAVATAAAGLLFGLAVWRATRTAPPGASLPPGMLVGVLVDRDGHGINGLRVAVGGRSTVSGEAGAFALAGLAVGRQRVVVTGPGVVPATLDDVPIPAGWARIEVDRAVAVAGHVTEAGVPAAGVEVAAATGSGGSHATVSDAAGAFRIDGLPEGRYAVVARRGSAAALVDGVERFGPGPFVDLELALLPAASLAGNLVDEAGAAVAGAHLVLVPAVADAAQSRVTSDASGHFALDGLPPGTWSIDVEAPGFLPLHQRGVELQAGANPALAVTVRHGGVVRGRVVDPAGVALAGAVVELVGNDGRVVASAQERSRRAAWAAGTQAAPSGRLLPSGELGVLVGPIPFPPAVGARVATATGKDDPAIAGLVTGADGGFRIDAVPPGTVTARATATGWARGEGAPVEVRAGTPVSTSVTLRRGATVLLHVVDETGRGVPATLVRLGPGFAVSDADGRARFEHVVGALTAIVDGPARSHAEMALAPPAELAEVEATVVLPTTRPAALAAAGAGVGVLRLELRDELTRGPILAFSVVARGPDGQVARRSGSRGELEVGGLATGVWTLRVEARGFATAESSFEIAEGAQTPLALEMSQGGVVGGTVYGEHGDPVAGATVECGPLRGTTSATGAFRLAGTPTGEVVVRAAHPEAGRGEVVVPLHPGDEALTLEIRLAPE